jgi:ppGpp synthetase/RelA/SpoT-type nucleotidyltranferase
MVTMIVPSPIQRKFDYNEVYINHVGTVVRDTVSNFCDINNFAASYRFKKVESIAEKIESGRFKNWSDIDDIFACAIIIPNLNYETQVITFLERAFLKVELKRRGSRLKDPRLFRFDSTRFIGKLRPREGETLDPNIYNISFEIQIRTAFEHAWTVATHDLIYKNNNIDWKRLRLASQLKASAEQMDMLAISFDQESEYVTECQWPEVHAKKNIISQFNLAVKEGTIRSELVPRDWTRFSDNIYKLITSTDESKKLNPNEKLKYGTCLAGQLLG